METEGKAKVVTLVWGAKIVQFLAVLGVLPWSIWIKRLNSAGKALNKFCPRRVHLCLAFCFHQRILIYIYRIKSNLPSSLFQGLLPQKAGTRITAQLSAAWGTICWVQRVLCEVYTLGWVYFGLFSNFRQLHVVCGSPRYNTGKCQILWLLSKQLMRCTTLKVPIFKKIKGAKYKKT